MRSLIGRRRLRNAAASHRRGGIDHRPYAGQHHRGNLDNHDYDHAATTSTPGTIPAPAVSVAYVQDLQPIFQSDCVPCHSGSRPDGNYSMSTYAQVMRAVAAGNARSALVVVTQRNASMYRYWSGNATTKANKAELVRKWVVENGAAQTR